MNYYETDREFMECIEYFAYEEVINEPGQQLPDEIRNMVILAVLIGGQEIDAYRERLPKALEAGVIPVMVKEMVYQASAYLGIGRVIPFLSVTNEILSARSIDLPFCRVRNIARKERLNKGIDIQSRIWGEHMKETQGGNHIDRWFAENCFGDYYTREGLTLNHRELIAFCFLAAQGGCEPQLAEHIKGNMNLGNDKDFLIRVVSQCLPYIGFPRSMNAIACINKVEEMDKGSYEC